MMRKVNLRAVQLGPSRRPTSPFVNYSRWRPQARAVETRCDAKPDVLGGLPGLG